MNAGPAHIEVRDLTMAYGDHVVQSGVSFSVKAGDVFVIMGGNGCGKTTLMRALIGLQRPSAGTVRYEGEDFWAVAREDRERMKRRLGIMFQGGALWSSLTLAENVALPLAEYTDLPPARIAEVVSFKLALVGLAGFEEFYPSELSGGMKKRAGLARAMALDPDTLIIDEPSSGLDPLTARRLDDLILALRDSLGATIVVISHDLASILAIGSDSIFLDADTHTMIPTGNPREALLHGDPKVRHFLTRGGA
ncbi:MAG: ATP-binding cassette domain-containing protein [Burkholderiales bacterium]|jgi:phospholipid/cholesterol/gamma-HCH transport system ATP-binding protein|uniref:Polyamine ABC transporter ATP-binding protein n=1 Tax=Candidatus Desulfobacillus denitrificans TaxID=2608985 RepID=A0A809S288_9PROT|nr:ATP-binding cassette domain-containing protein [Zoogloeaceae bacterium]MBP9655833.1 ATP-binding cassette domain-containing protein [Rhodocyclaceae bacterium]MCZ2175753.1 ATP-binding cassette domain-containing protein [Burkholderiales bacterium]OQY75849.1 MAG: polyamine ABC transporter ATP-binding protein [Rhodocyclaceae bacterium UTPRO2]BBO19661.1 polyamine ABC transporter ATP-binding protein [Candidatus Desulfobacillus denitrificans]GIK45661.1 MAG: ABC transporter ATP-binding protein [Beta